MSVDAEQMFALLPAVYRTRDAQSGGPLRALFEVMAAQSEIVQENIQQLYDDQFIETCAPWVIPYIGDLIGYDSIYEVSSASGDSRAEVANTIGYRRRKGTLLALEQMCGDVSGRAAIAVEEFRRLITTESMRHVEPRHQATVDLRAGRALERLGTAFDVESHTVDVRRIASRVSEISGPDATPLDMVLHGGGRFNIPNVAIHLWRWQSWPVVDAPAFEVGAGRYTFSPLGADMPLFSRWARPLPFTTLLTRANTPQPIARDELLDYYGPSGSVLLIADGVPVDASQICAANLSDRPGGALCVVESGKIAIDPELGRIQYAADVPPPQTLRLDYLYGFPAAIGGGGYDRSSTLEQVVSTGDANFFALVGSVDWPDAASAVAAWNEVAPGSSGIIVLPGFESLTVDLTGSSAVQLPAGSSLSILAGAPDPAGGPRDVVWNEAWPTVFGNIEVTGVATGPTADGAPPAAGQLLISGVRIAGQLLVGGAASSITLSDATLVPGLGLTDDQPTGPGAPSAGPAPGKPNTPGTTPGEPGAADTATPGKPSAVVTAPGATLVLNRVISGPVAANAAGTTRICASILDASSASGVAYAAADLESAGADLHVEDSTIVGKVRARTITLASNTIFHSCLSSDDSWLAAVWASRRQAGCVRFCVLALDSITPRRYHCLAGEDSQGSALEPSFVTLSYGLPAYALLSGDCPAAIWNGAANGSQIGVYLQIQETEAVTNVQLRAEEYLPAMLESGVFIHPSQPACGRSEHLPVIGAGSI
jgi:hypothetical protein